MESKNKEPKPNDSKTLQLEFGSLGSAKVKSIDVNEDVLVYGKAMASTSPAAD
ncbi:MAG: hypothetical protein K2P81_11945 [Bacteriovoracaceae bacterium]|nr:hypothetical protein [Bacteriovoracaceae bacterium]